MGEVTRSRLPSRTTGHAHRSRRGRPLVLILLLCLPLLVPFRRAAAQQNNLILLPLEATINQNAIMRQDLSPPPRRQRTLRGRLEEPIAGVPPEKLAETQFRLISVDFEPPPDLHLDSAAFSSAWQRLIGKEISLKELGAVLVSIEDIYRQLDYVVIAKAPPQDLSSGRIHLTVSDNSMRSWIYLSETIRNNKIMVSNIQKEKAEMFLKFHQDKEILVLLNSWDIGSSKLVEACGYKAIATTSMGIAASLGYPDCQVIQLSEMIEAITGIVNGVQVPVTVDIEAGYGNNSNEIIDSVKKIVATGIVGINIEDSIDLNPVLIDEMEFCERI